MVGDVRYAISYVGKGGARKRVNVDGAMLVYILLLHGNKLDRVGKVLWHMGGVDKCGYVFNMNFSMKLLGIKDCRCIGKKMTYEMYKGMARYGEP